MIENSLIPENCTIIKPKRKYKKKELSVFTYEDYTKNDIILTNYTIPILKQVCKLYKLAVSGKKDELIAYDQGKNLFEHFGSKDKVLYADEEGDHHNILVTEHEFYKESGLFLLGETK